MTPEQANQISIKNNTPPTPKEKLSQIQNKQVVPDQAPIEKNNTPPTPGEKLSQVVKDKFSWSPKINDITKALQIILKITVRDKWQLIDLLDQIITNELWPTEGDRLSLITKQMMRECTDKDISIEYPLYSDRLIGSNPKIPIYVLPSACF